ncbi:MAG: ribosomal protein S18-alanine N-acetyltransferase [Candidatus Korarchaeota archaeon]|nr:ribosomal protein S18-alanine N-acetyltransferase [Candidatus Korarchaeota archaeon]
MDVNVTIRKAKRSDLDSVHEIEVASFNHPYSKDFLALLLRGKPPTYLNLVAEENEKIVGYTSTRIEDNVGHTLSIAVHPQKRREGIGSRLMQRTLDKLTGKCRAMFLEVRKSNVRAQRFYHALGFRKRRVKKGYYNNGEDAIIYYKLLDRKSTITR